MDGTLMYQFNPYQNMLMSHAMQFGGDGGSSFGGVGGNPFSQFMGGGGSGGAQGTFGQDNDQRQDNFADRAADKPWKFGPAPGGGFMRLQGGMLGQGMQPRPMQPPMQGGGQPPMPQQGHGFGNEQQQPMQPPAQMMLPPQYNGGFGGGY